MRLRKVKGASEMIAAHPQIVIPNGEALKGNWQSVFEKINPFILRLEWEKVNLSLEWPNKTLI